MNGKVCSGGGLWKIKQGSECNHAVLAGEAYEFLAVEWQPIETAPKDDTRVLVCWADSNRKVVIASYGPKYSSGGVNYGDDWGSGHGWQNTFEAPPTHWKPLPESFKTSAPPQ